MAMQVKICGINTEASLQAAIAAGASHVGFNFYPPSPRAVSLAEAAALASQVPPSVQKVALMVDPDDTLIEATIAAIQPSLLQLHGSEDPGRVDAIKARFALPVMKAVKVALAADAQAAERYDGHADWILFDAKPPKDLANALPGGNGVAFDWRLLAGYRGATPWLLSGGLGAENVAEAIRVSGADWVDVSSGVEDRPGAKNADKIRRFVQAARAAPAG